MRSGFLPSQQRELRKASKKADAFDHFRQRTRRRFVALGLLGIAGSAGTFWLGRRGPWAPGTGEVDVASPAPLDAAHRLALGPDADLRANLLARPHARAWCSGALTDGDA